MKAVGVGDRNLDGKEFFPWHVDDQDYEEMME